MTKDQRLEAIILALSFVPLTLLAAAFPFVNYCWPFGAADYERYREFWGGNPNEVFSHWLDTVVMSGNAFSLGWLLTVEAFARRQQTKGRITAWLKTMQPICLFGSIAAGVALDHENGEGTVMYVSVMGFLPVLGSWCYLLRKIASFYHWIARKVFILCTLYVVLNTGAQLLYEPSGTGGPNGLFIAVWLGSMALAAMVALGLVLRSGSLRQFCSRTLRFVCKPSIWVSLLVLFLGIAIPLTIHARHIRQPRQTLAIKWLDDIETALSVEIVRELKNAATARPQFEKMVVPEPARALLGHSRIALGNSLRIYIPVTNGRYLFLWANKSFDYCDVRPLNTSQHGTVEVDQDFIEGLREHQGTCETWIYSVLWSPYLAGRVLNSGSGEVKAICVIKSPD